MGNYPKTPLKVRECFQFIEPLNITANFPPSCQPFNSCFFFSSSGRFQEMSDPADDFATHEVCEYDDTLAIFVGRLLLTGSSLVGLVFVFLCVNGHFMGQEGPGLGEVMGYG